jgi:hypothetical protein
MKLIKFKDINGNVNEVVGKRVIFEYESIETITIYADTLYCWKDANVKRNFDMKTFKQRIFFMKEK